jgi:hypothetical protein
MRCNLPYVVPCTAAHYACTTIVSELFFYKEKHMKALKVILCLALVVSALVYAAKVEEQWGTLTVQHKGELALATITQGWIVAAGGTDKSSVNIVAANGDEKLLVDNLKTVKGKGVSLDTLAIGTVDPVPADNALATFYASYKPAGSTKGVALKLKGGTIGTVLATTLKAVKADGVGSAAGAGKGNKGVVISSKGGIGGKFGDAGNEKYSYIGGPATVPTVVKKAKAKAAMGDVVVYGAAAKAGKTKIKAKGGASGDGVFATTPADWSPKSDPVPADAATADPNLLPF